MWENHSKQKINTVIAPFKETTNKILTGIILRSFFLKVEAIFIVNNYYNIMCQVAAKTEKDGLWWYNSYTQMIVYASELYVSHGYLFQKHPRYVTLT